MATLLPSFGHFSGFRRTTPDIRIVKYDEICHFQVA